MLLKSENIRLKKKRIFQSDKQRLKIVSEQNTEYISDVVSEKLLDKLKETFANNVYKALGDK